MRLLFLTFVIAIKCQYVNINDYITRKLKIIYKDCIC